MTEYLLILLIFFVIVYALVKGVNVTININHRHEFTQEDRQLLEDIYNKDGDDKEENAMIKSNMDEVIRSINSIMYDEEVVDG